MGKIEVFRKSEIVFWGGIPCVITHSVIVHFIVMMCE